MDILTFLGGSLGGSIVGALGAAFNKWHDAKTKIKLMELEMQQAKIMNEHEEKLMALKIESVTKEMEYKGITESIQADRATYSVGSTNLWLIFVDVVRGLMRPALTCMLLIYMMWTLFYLTRTYNVILSDAQVYQLVYSIVDNLVVCSSIALTWWFGSRPQPKKGG
jgi:hypothetical protein